MGLQPLSRMQYMLSDDDVRQAIDRAKGIVVAERAPTKAEYTYLLQVLLVIERRYRAAKDDERYWQDKARRGGRTGNVCE